MLEAEKPDLTVIDSTGVNNFAQFFPSYSKDSCGYGDADGPH